MLNMFEDLPKSMKFITSLEAENNDIPIGWCRVWLGDVPIGWRELTEEELTIFFKEE